MNFLACAVLSGAFVGCSSQQEFVTVRDASRNPFVSSLGSLPGAGGKPSERTTQVLRRYNLEGEYRRDTDGVAAQIAANTTPDTYNEHEFAIAELEYLAAKRTESSDPGQAISHYGTALLHTYRYLFDEQRGVPVNPYDPQFRGACDLYNQSLEGMLRLVQRAGPLRAGEHRTIQTAEHQCSFDVELHSRGWHGKDIDELLFVNDYRVAGLRNHYRTYGLGVPLIAVRNHGHEDHPAEAYYPRGLTFPLTAFLRITNPQAEIQHNAELQHVDASQDDARQDDARQDDASQHEQSAGSEAPRFALELRDPIDSDTLQVAGRNPPLESDLSTPLAYFLNKPELKGQTLSTLGLLKPDSVSQLQGLYMLEPFDPNKMPVLMVHGLWSSPVTWMEMVNDLRSDRQICERYQFWFYLYPTGQPFWISGAQLRRDLAELRAGVDPHRRQPALDQMVLVGHSMGGLVSKLQSVDSGDDFWRINSDRPFNELIADPQLRGPLAGAYFFRPNPSIRRVVTIGTPHRGSSFANDLTRWAGRKLITSPSIVVQGRRQLLANNQHYFRSNSALDIHTSIDSLAPESPLLPVLLDAQPAPWVTYHNIVGRLPEEGLGSRISEVGDGVVSLASARLDGVPRVASQEMVQADHVSIHRHPKSIYHVRQVLINQLQELERLPHGGFAPPDSAPPGSGPVRLVGRPPTAGAANSAPSAR